MASLPPNINSWKNIHFLEFCKQSPKYSILLDFLQKNSIDGAFFFTVTREDFANIESDEISPEGVDLFFQLQGDLKQVQGIAVQSPGENEGLDQELPLEENNLPLSLVIIDNENNRKEFLQNEIRMGRDNQSQIYYDDKSISRTHATITRIGNSFFIRDESSSNGTFLKLFPNNQYLLVPGMMFDVPKVAEMLVIQVGLMQVKLKVTSENEEESSKEFTLNLFGQQTWVVGRDQNQLVCDLAENAQNFQTQLFEIKQVGSKNVIRILHPEGLWSKIGSKELKEIFKFYPIRKNDVIRIGDNVELKIAQESVFEEFLADLCLLCKVKYQDSVEFVNLDCKHVTACRVCRNTEFMCPQCSEPVKTWENINNVVMFDDHEY